MKFISVLILVILSTSLYSQDTLTTSAIISATEEEIEVDEIKSDDDLIFKVVEQMPRFPGCESMIESDMEKEACAKSKMLQFIYKNLKYPKAARYKGVEGMAVVQFVVEKDGSIGQVEILRDPGEGCGEAAADVIRLMNEMEDKWIPGTQRGLPVSVLYTLPVKFRVMLIESPKKQRRKWRNR